MGDRWDNDELDAIALSGYRDGDGYWQLSIRVCVTGAHGLATRRFVYDRLAGDELLDVVSSTLSASLESSSGSA